MVQGGLDGLDELIFLEAVDDWVNRSRVWYLIVMIAARA